MTTKTVQFVLAFILLAAFSTSFAAKPRIPVAPFAEAHADVTSGQEPLDVSFSARGSFDPDNSVLTYSWDFGDGTTAMGLDPTHAYAYLAPGFYVAVLTVTDARGLFDVTSIEIRVTPGSLPAELTVFASPETGSVPLTVEFASAVDGGAGALDYTWEFGDGGVSSLSNPAYTYIYVGTFLARLTVVNQNGDTDIAFVEVTVTP
jgi:large repetitive protein